MYKVITGPHSIQGSPEWLEFRRTKIGASMAAAILGIDPWSTPLKLWEEIVYCKEKPVTQAMQRGKDLEGKAREWLSNTMNVSYQPAVLQSDEHPFMIASLDAFCELEDHVATAEIKIPNKLTHQKAIDGIIPDHYYAQMQHQMIVSGVKSMIYCSFDGENGVILPCIRDEEFCQKLIAKEKAFLDSVINFESPEPIDQDWTEIIDPEQILKVSEYQNLKEQKDGIESRLEELKFELIATQSSSRAKLDNFRMRKMHGKTIIDYRSFLKDMELTPSDKYRKKGKDFWMISC